MPCYHPLLKLKYVVDAMLKGWKKKGWKTSFK